jgi:hypothetical protein
MNDSLNRVVRTAWQAGIAFAASVPITTGVNHASNAQTAKTGGVVAVLTVVVSAIHNWLDQKGYLSSSVKTDVQWVETELKSGKILGQLQTVESSTRAIGSQIDTFPGASEVEAAVEAKVAPEVKVIDNFEAEAEPVVAKVVEEAQETAAVVVPVTSPTITSSGPVVPTQVVTAPVVAPAPQGGVYIDGVLHAPVDAIVQAVKAAPPAV